MVLTSKTKRLWQGVVKTEQAIQTQILAAYGSSLRDYFGTAWEETWQENPAYADILAKMDEEIRTYLIDQEVQRGKIKRWLTAAKKAALFGVPFREGRYVPIDKLRKIKEEMTKHGGTVRSFHAACRKYIEQEQKRARNSATAKENVLLPHFDAGMVAANWSIEIMERLVGLLSTSSKGFKSNARPVAFLRKTLRQMQSYLLSRRSDTKIEELRDAVA
jgi:hypothetical protein